MTKFIVMALVALVTLAPINQGYGELVYRVDNEQTSEESIEEVCEVLKSRLESLGYRKYTVEQKDNNQIEVHVYNIEPDDLIIMNKYLTDSVEVNFLDPSDNLIVSDEYIAKVYPQFTEINNDNMPVVLIQFDEEGTERFKEATTELSRHENPHDKVIRVEVDGKTVAAPIVQQPITEGEAIITGIGSLDKVQELVTLLSLKRLPYKLEKKSSQYIKSVFH